jgi:hypothetical protein
MAAELCLSVSLSYVKGSLSCRKILRHGADGRTFPPKKALLWIFIALKNLSLLVVFEPANLGYNGMHDSLYTTENDNILLKININVIPISLSVFEILIYKISSPLSHNLVRSYSKQPALQHSNITPLKVLGDQVTR